jgi:hypothetical protein
MKGLEGPSGPGMPGGPPDLAFPATCSTRKCRVPGRAAGTRSITSSTDFSDHRRLLLIPAACESAQRCAAFSWPVTFWNMSGPIISPHKPLDGRCSSFIDFQSGYHNYFEPRQAQDVPADPRPRPIVAQALGSPLVWFTSLKNAAGRTMS